MDVVRNIQVFYMDPKILREFPTMRTVKQHKQHMVMEVSVHQAYTMWKEANPEETEFVSFSVFTRLRPSRVLLQRKIKLNQCLCEYCTAILLKLQCLNRTLQITNCKELKVKDKYELISLSMCPKGDNRFPQLKCIDRCCDACGISLLEYRLKEFMESNGNRMVTWQRWETKSYMHDGKQKD